MTEQTIQERLARAEAEIERLKHNGQQAVTDHAAFRTILDASPVPQALNDDNQKVIYLNPAFINTFGYELKDIPTLSDWWPKAYPDPVYRQKVADNWLKHLQDASREARPFEAFEVRICCKDGSVKTVMAGASSLQGGDERLHLVTLYDVTQVKEVETELHQAVALLENVINSTPDLIAVKNKQLQTVLCNRAYARAVGKSREDMYGKTDIENGWEAELVEGNPEKGIRGFMQDDLAALSGRDVHNPCDPANIEGERRIFDTHKRPLRDAKGNIIGMFLIARDVTERYEAEKKLQISESRFRTIIEGIENIAVQGYDKNRRVIFWSPSSTALYGYTEAEALGKKLEELIVPDEMRQDVIKAIDSWIEDGVDIAASEMLLKNKQGQEVPVYSSHTLQRSDNGEVELFCLDVSMAELRKTQEELQRVNTELDATLRAIPDLLFELDEDGKYINIWARDEGLLAAEKRALLGCTVAEKLPEEAARIVMESLAEAAQKGYSQGQIIQLPLPDGRRWFELSIALKSESRGRKHFIVLSRDITERINTEEQLRRSQKMDALGKLTGGIAHDFNNMLSVILGYGELLQTEMDNGSRSSVYVEQIMMAGNRARALTSKLLSFSRNLPAEKKEWNINDILNEDRHMLEKTLTAKVELDFDLDAELWMTCVDRDTLSDAILNMCINSMHAMPDGGRLIIGTRNISLSDNEIPSLSLPPGEYVRLSLQDTGTGIAAEIRDKIFEPFFTTKENDGTGLGLSQVYGFVKQSEGDILVESETGRGTCMSIFLPRYQQSKKDRHYHVDPVEAMASNQSCSILIVDDEPAIRALAGEVLEKQFYTVYFAANGEDALKILAEEDICLMLTDVIMPGMNGYQLAAQVSRQYPALKIIIASGYNDDAPLREEDSALYQYLDKPYRTAELLKAVREALDQM